MNEVKIRDEIIIENLIYEIRGKQVMLDSDLARLYKCANGTKTINLAVKRHINRFPERFMFQLTKDEYNNLRFQLETTNNMSRTLPYVFTEEGVAMLATVLRTEIAEKVSIRIMDAFVAMRHYIGNNIIEQRYINDMVLSHDSRIKKIEDVLDKFDERKTINEIFFNGQTYDAYSRIIDIMKEAKGNIVIIDSYADKTTLDMICKIDINVILITRKKSKLSELDIDKYKSEYHNLKVIYNDTFHDRYIVIDNKTIYHLGTSINHAGKKTFSINVLIDELVIENILSVINKIIN